MGGVLLQALAESDQEPGQPKEHDRHSQEHDVRQHALSFSSTAGDVSPTMKTSHRRLRHLSRSNAWPSRHDKDPSQNREAVPYTGRAGPDFDAALIRSPSSIHGKVQMRTPKAGTTRRHESRLATNGKLVAADDESLDLVPVLVGKRMVGAVSRPGLVGALAATSAPPIERSDADILADMKTHITGEVWISKPVRPWRRGTGSCGYGAWWVERPRRPPSSPRPARFPDAAPWKTTSSLELPFTATRR